MSSEGSEAKPVKDDVRAYINDQLKRVNKGLSEVLNKNIVVPMTEAIEKINILSKDVESLKSSFADIVAKPDRSPDPPARSADQPGFASVDDAINLLPTHIEESMNFVLLVVSLIEGKRKYTPDEMAERIANDYGKVMGKHFVTILASAIKDSRKQALKTACDEILKKLGGP